MTSSVKEKCRKLRSSDLVWQSAVCGREKGWVKVRENFPERVTTELKSE